MGVIDRLRDTFDPLRYAAIPPALPYIDNFWPYINSNGNTYPMGLTTSIKGEKQEGPTRPSRATPRSAAPTASSSPAWRRTSGSSARPASSGSG
jgi:hypothetical protein